MFFIFRLIEKTGLNIHISPKLYPYHHQQIQLTQHIHLNLLQKFYTIDFMIASLNFKMRSYYFTIVDTR